MIHLRPLTDDRSSHIQESQHVADKSGFTVDSSRTDDTVRHHRLRSLSTNSSMSLNSFLVSPDYDRFSATPPLRPRSLRHSPMPGPPTHHGLADEHTYTPAMALSPYPKAPRGREHRGQELSGVGEDRQEDTVAALVESHHDEDTTTMGWYATETVDVPGIDVAQGRTSELTDETGTRPEDTQRGGTMRRWLSTLRKRKSDTFRRPLPVRQHKSYDEHHDPPLKEQERSNSAKPHHRKGDSKSSSLNFVTVVRSATATLASTSIATISRRKSQKRRENLGSSQQSDTNPRPSIDSQWSIMDAAAQQRSRKRRNKLEELIRSEESYIADIKALSNAYFTILGHQPGTSNFTRSAAQRLLSQMLDLHGDLIAQLHHLVPFAEHDQRTATSPLRSPVLQMRTRWHSIDVVPTRLGLAHSKLATIRQGRRSLSLTRSREKEQMMAECSAHVVSAVASLFSEQVARFTVYEEFGANFEAIQRDIEDTQQATTGWQDFDRAIEAISTHVNPVRHREANRKKATTLKDLLIKPIQRLPRYELLFGDLHKLTPVCDDPTANIILEDLLVCLKGVCQRVNDAKRNPLKARLLERTWILGERLTFSNQIPRSIFLRLLGQVHLCGCLFVSYRNRDCTEGLYVISILFETTLLLAVAADDDHYRYNTVAGIPLANSAIVETDNGKGLQCYTTPHSWKLVFEHTARMYEIIMTACSAVEAETWRQQLEMYIKTQALATSHGTSKPFELQSPLIAGMRSVGQAFGKPGSFVRRMSVRRSHTIGPTTDSSQVIIKNTKAVKETVDSASHTSLQLPRSQSMATPSHVQTLAPRRADRIRLESLLVDVWTKDLLPYPGMTPRRADPIRASASHVIRKFSKASITTNFSSSKRSASYTSISNCRKEDMPPPPKPVSQDRYQQNRRSKPSNRPLIDFHNSPDAFLPTDFGLQPPDPGRRRSAFRTLTMTMERPFSPLLGAENKTSTLRRAQSVKLGKDATDVISQAQSVCTADVPIMPERNTAHNRESAITQSAQAHESVRPSDVETAKAAKKSKSRSKLMKLFS